MAVKFLYGAKNDKKKPIQSINYRIGYGKDFDSRGSLKLDISLEWWDFDKNTLIDVRIKPTGDYDTNQRVIELTKLLHNIEEAYKDEFLKLKLTNRLKSLTKEEWNNWVNEVIDKGRGVVKSDRYLITEVISEAKESKITLKDISQSTIDKYDTTIRLLKEFQVYTGKKYYSDDIDLKFYIKLKEWYRLPIHRQRLKSGEMSEPYSLSDTYFGNAINVLKSSIKHFRTTIPNFPFSPQIENEDFKRPRSKSRHEVLREEHIEKLYNYKGAPYKEKVRDLAIILYHACLRYADLENEMNNGFKNLRIYKTSDGWEWDIHQSKTDDNKTIPLHKRIVDMYESGRIKELYNSKGNRNKIIERQKFSEWFKEILRELEIPFNKIGAHTMRRSFITNMINNRKTHVEVMAYSGHKDIATFQAYCQRHNIKVTAGNTIPTE